MRIKPAYAGEWLLSAREALARRGTVGRAKRLATQGTEITEGLERAEGEGAETGHSDREQRFQEASLEAQLLLGHVLEEPRAWVLAHPETPLSDTQRGRLDNLLASLMDGAPLPYLIGHWEFYGLDFTVTPAVLIPRPETELLVEQALEWLRRHPNRWLAADVGTGSGCIAVTLARLFPGLRMLAVDRSRAALKVARHNAQRADAGDRITFWQGDLLSAAAGPLDLVCANLPYIPTALLQNLPPAQHEPTAALDGGADGLQFTGALLADAPRWLAPGGLLLLEIQYDQGPAVSALARAALPQARVTVLTDLAGLPRLVRVENQPQDQGE